MTNFEKFKENLTMQWFIDNGKYFGVDKNTNEIKPCREMICKHCKFTHETYCNSTDIIKWLNADCEEIKDGER